MQKIKPIIIILILCCISSISWGKSATLIFTTDTDVKVEIYEPIDDACNYSIVSNRLDLKPNISITYKMDVSDFCFIRIVYSTGFGYSLIVQEGDNIDVAYEGNGIKLDGNNARGNMYLNNFNRYAAVDSIFDLHLKPSIDINAINADLYKTFRKGFNEDLDILRLDKTVSSKFIQILSKDIGYAIADVLTRDYYVILRGLKGEILADDSIKILSQLDSIYQEYPPFTDESIKYRYSTSKYMGEFYRQKYNTLSAQEKDEILQGYDEDTFGPYVSYLLASDRVQLTNLGDALMLQLDYQFNEFDENKMLNYFEKRFPSSQYLQLIKSRIKEVNKKSNQLTASNDSTIFIKEQISTLNDLSFIDGLKGNFIYIDLWATWCLPCKREFQYNNDLHELLEKYEDIKAVYISIDEDKFNDIWERNVKQIPLAGYNIRASKLLYNDIQSKIYKNSSVSIPRYILLDPEGNIINDDLPRPSQIDLLKKELDILLIP